MVLSPLSMVPCALKNGHPEPYNIEYLEIGNENNQPDPAAQSDHYYERFKKFKDAVLAKYPKMHLIGNVVAWAMTIRSGEVRRA